MQIAIRAGYFFINWDFYLHFTERNRLHQVYWLTFRGSLLLQIEMTMLQHWLCSGLALNNSLYDWFGWSFGRVSRPRWVKQNRDNITHFGCCFEVILIEIAWQTSAAGNCVVWWDHAHSNFVCKWLAEFACFTKFPIWEKINHID